MPECAARLSMNLRDVNIKQILHVKINRHGSSKISQFPPFLYLFCSLIIHQHWFQKYSTAKTPDSFSGLLPGSFLFQQ